MLSRFVRIQLAIFTVVGIIGVIAMALFYIQTPTLLGIGRMTVTLELPAAGGLYRFSNVTYRGVQIGKVTSVGLTPTGAKATLSLNTSPKIPADVKAEVRSVSAVGEQYVDLRPRTDAPPYLHNGSVIAARDTTIPQAVGPMLDQVSALTDSISKTKLNQLLDESFEAFNGTGYDLSLLSDSSSRIAADANSVADRTRTLTEDTVPLLDSQTSTTDSVRTWARSLAGISDVLVTDDSKVRTVLQNGPGAAKQATALLEQVKPTLPILLANLTTIGQIGITYHPSLEQLLVMLPPVVSATLQSGDPSRTADGMPVGDFAITVDDPPICTVGFMPPNQWRSPEDTTVIDTPDGLYCKLPQDSPLTVRGARNYPCMGQPGKRAPTVEICESDQPYMPLAMKQHVLGPYPLDPNLLSQGVPPDDRITANDRIFGPVEGTPLPAGAVPRGTPPGPRGTYGPPGPGYASPPVPSSASMSTQAADLPPIAPLDVPDSGEVPSPKPPTPAAPPRPAAPAPGPSGEPQAAPSSFGPKQSTHTRAVATAQYDPRTGRYLAPDGKIYQQSDLARAAAPKSWQDMLPT